MKSFHLKNYHIQDLIPPNFPEGSFRVYNTQEIDEIKKADVICLPWQFREEDNLTPQLLHKIILKFNLDERRIACQDCSDFDAISLEHPNIMAIRCNLKPWHKEKMPRSIPWFWPVQSFTDIAPVPIGGFRYSVSGHMWLSSKTRKLSCESIKQTFGEDADIVTRDEFFGYIERDDIERSKLLKAAFKESMHKSLLALCPASIPSIFPYRAWEAWSAARVPILIGDGFQFPFANKIDYAGCMIQIADTEAANAGPILKEWLSKHSDAEIIEMGKRGRAYWETWLNRDIQESLFTIAIEERLKADRLL